MTPAPRRIVIAGGGTAGHVNPALALASALADEDVIFVGTSSGLEARLVPAAGWRFEAIVVRGFDRAKPLAIAGTGFMAARATVAATRLLRKLAPDVVVGMGGYVSLPVCVAARVARIPVVLHEQNIVFGLANRICKAFARRVCVSFEETLDTAGPHGVFVGNP
ncbi:MAG TPA: glycosyltransferase, partial [Actinomycetota bacterium]|nr:glycosyltransferase [Actinomycetota bacterium]